MQMSIGNKAPMRALIQVKNIIKVREKRPFGQRLQTQTLNQALLNTKDARETKKKKRRRKTKRKRRKKRKCAARQRLFPNTPKIVLPW